MLKAFDAGQLHDWAPEEYPGVVCKIRGLTAREQAECQTDEMGIGMLAAACRGLWSIEGVVNEDGTPRELVRHNTPSGRGVVAEEFFDGLPVDFWSALALEVLRHSGVSEADQGNS